MAEYLFAEISRKAAGETIRPHAHDFWQVELVRVGRVESTVLAECHVGQEGDALLIPPGLTHSLVFKAPVNRCLILKFRAPPREHPVACLAAARPLLTPWGQLLELLTGDPPALPPGRRRQLELLLDLLLHEAYPEEASPRRALRERADAYLARRAGGYVTAGELARHLGYSVSQVRRRFHAEQGVALKSYLDRRRAKAAEGLLRYSELTIGEIARRQEFPDLPAFSRFVRRHLGASPRAIRQRG